MVVQTPRLKLHIFKKWESSSCFLFSGISMRCVKEEHTAINMTLHYLENGTVMLNYIYQKELFFLPLGFVLKVLIRVAVYF